MAVLTYLEAIRQAMEQEMERDRRVFILGEDVAARKTPFFERTIRQFGDYIAFNLLAKRFDSRENEPASRPRLAITYTVVMEQAFVPVIVR